jgi:hypothetical protein
MLIILTIFRKKDELMTHISCNYNIMNMEYLIEELFMVVSAVDMSRKRFKRFVVTNVDDEEYSGEERTKPSLLKDISICTVSEYERITKKRIGLKNIDEYILNQKDKKFIHVMLEKMKDVVKSEEVSIIDSDNEEVSIMNSDDKEFLDDPIETDKSSGEISIDKNINNKVHFPKNTTFDPGINKEIKLNLKSKSIEQNDDVIIEMDANSIKYAGLKLRINGLNSEEAKNCAMLLGTGFLELNKFIIINGHAVLNKPCGYAFGDYLTNRSFNRISRFGLDLAVELIDKPRTIFSISIMYH